MRRCYSTELQIRCSVGINVISPLCRSNPKIIKWKLKHSFEKTIMVFIKKSWSQRKFYFKNEIYVYEKLYPIKSLIMQLKRVNI